MSKNTIFLQRGQSTHLLASGAGHDEPASELPTVKNIYLQKKTIII